MPTVLSDEAPPEVHISDKCDDISTQLQQAVHSMFHKRSILLNQHSLHLPHVI